MAIPCPQCGRKYDVTLFEFGRTIHCTCGERVGLEQRIGPTPSPTTGPLPSSPADEPCFIVDAMLGKVARWLRTLGYDTVYDDAISDADLVRRSLLEDRIILTRDRRIPREWRIRNCLVLEEDGTLERNESFSRCPDCGRIYWEGSHTERMRRLIDRVFEQQRSSSG